jgi:hypothetical protein
MKFINHDFVRFLLVMLTLCSVVLGWSFPNTSCACANASSTISITQKLVNLVSSCCFKCKEVQNCSCCTINEDQEIPISNIMSATGCQCVLHSNGLPGSKMLISEIADTPNLRPQLINAANTLSLNTNLNQALSRKIDNCSFKIKDSTSLILIYCQLNI